jgi:hypothetical protein
MARGAGLLSFLIVSSMLCGCTLITGPQAGQGSADRETQRKAEPVIAALEQFHKDHGSYPRKIQELFPRYIADQHALGVGSFSYSKQGPDYVLMYDYVSGFAIYRGINQCVYYSKKKKWECGGYV